MPNNYSIYESGSGGRYELRNNLPVHTSSLLPEVYIAMFGGNKCAKPWYGNENEQAERRVVSETEAMLLNMVINSHNLAKLEQAMLSDCKKLEKYGEIKCKAIASGNNRISLNVTISGNLYKFIYDKGANELITNKQI